MLNGPFSPWPSFTSEEAQAVQDTLLSNKVNYWTGSECREFETEFANFVGCNYSIALANGTVALDLAFNALQIGKGDEVIVTSRTYIASVSSIINSGAKPIFADVDYNSQNITANSIEEVLTPSTKAIVCVHLAGWPCDMDPIMSLASKKNLFVIEDCAQAHGALYKGYSVGSIGHIGCWSFCQDKIMTTGGDGGMVTTNNKNLWEKMWSFKDHGKSWEAVYQQKHPPGFRWLHNTFGTNWRMTEMQAVIGRIQLKRMPEWQKQRFSNAKQIWEITSVCNKITAPELKCLNCDNICNCKHAAYRCYIFCKGNKEDRDNIMLKINQKGVPCFSGSCPEVYLEKAFDNTNFRPKKRLPTAKLLGETSLMFLCHPSLKKYEIDKTCDVIKEVCN